MKRSFFTIFALWLLMLIVVLLTGIAFKAHIQTRKTKLFIDKSRAFYLAVSGINIAKNMLSIDLDEGAEVDYWGEDWAQGIEKEVAYSVPRRMGKLTVEIEDESARLNINNIVDEKNIFEGLFAALDIEENKIDNITDYVDEDGDGSYEDNVKNTHLSVAEELLLIADFDPEDYGKINDFVTVFTDSKVNVNTASREVLASLHAAGKFNDGLPLPLTLDNIATFVTDRGEGNDVYCGIGGSDYSDYKVCSHLNDDIITNSSFFKIISQAEVGRVTKKITCIVRRESDKITPEYWYEE